MSERAFTGRVIVSSEGDRAALWRTHRVFNERLRWVLRRVHRMRRGKPDPRYAEIFKAISTSQRATAILEAVTSLDWSGNKNDRWCELARELRDEGRLLFDRKADLPRLSKEFRRKLFEGAFQMIHGHEELVARWKNEHDEWKKARATWERENPEYMQLRPALEAFEGEHGQASKRRQRWHKWLAFLKSRPDLAAWRGGPAVVHKMGAAAKERVRRAPRNKRNKIEAEEFFRVNPELKALDEKHGYYQRQFVRPWAKRRNADGFKHRPTFTEPSAERHPFWFQFKKNQTYKDLDLKAGSIRLQLLASDAAGPGWRWHAFNFRPDRRLRLIRKSEDAEQTGKGKNRFTCVFSDPALGIDRAAEIRGAKLIFRPARPDGDVYLSFTVDVPDLPGGLSITQKACDKYGPQWVRKEATKRLAGKDLVTCAVDLGIRQVAAATVRRGGQIVRARIIREGARPGGGPRLPAIQDHKRSLAAGRRKRGKPVRGEESFIQLQTHINKMGEDRFKKGARRIVNFAYENQCDLIIMEKLAGLIPDAERQRGINRALVNWNRGHLAKWVKQLAADAGIRVVEVHPYMTSQLCSRCGAMGARFSCQNGDPVFDAGGKIFACPECGYSANADHNASINLHRKFYGELAQVEKLRNGVYRVSKPGQSPGQLDLAAVKSRLRLSAAAICRGDPTPF